MVQRILVVGLGRMGLAHAMSYHQSAGFEIVGLMSRSAKTAQLPADFARYPRFESFEEALHVLRPDAVSINSYPDTHAAYAIQAMEAGAHVFLEKPLATTLADAQAVIAVAKAHRRKLVLGYILRVHPLWQRFVEQAQMLGSPLVMRFSLNQQSQGEAWAQHRNLIESVLPIVDCGVHYLDVMCQMTGKAPISVQAVGAALWDETPQMNYGQLQVRFADGSVGWFESGWGPMMSTQARFLRDVIGPKGAVSMATSEGADALHLHSAALDANKAYLGADQRVELEDRPSHQALCDRLQETFLRAIEEDLDLSLSMDAALNSLRIVLAAQESMATGQTIALDAVA